ncbi:MAG: multicopper oxidase domain-containing protein [Jaaginema sp. PMC 1079.18]|nr:multicopper oxidase domain-containing protein [Jaaginema sp. PMC 1080.18]MEC4853210.1 multicopper oxidase domain-containing protein [Jaaginema sp. PMC 1079.18]MEC4866644.1 multicopper oxidase domain-containing protein [Jaaginema sp. PMC 1078.18]
MKLNRRQLLLWGLTGVGTTTAGISIQGLTKRSPARVPPPTAPPKNALDNPFDPMQILRDFDYGTIKHEENCKIREFRVIADSNPFKLNKALTFIGWNLNHRVPGPTLRAKVGDRVRIIFENHDGHSHTLHFHGKHPAAVDGIEPVRHDQSFVYEFDVTDYGLFPYHCHVTPVTRHVGKGLYGLLIVDPQWGRPPADEMVLVMGGYDLDDDGKNDLYAFNGIPNYYRDRPIRIYQNQLIRLYLLNMIEFDAAVTFHIHANLFELYPMGHSRKPQRIDDVVTIGTAERHILEFRYPYPGRYMFHPHQDEMAEHGCMGWFEVIAV